jgi:hypothetical protein
MKNLILFITCFVSFATFAAQPNSAVRRSNALLKFVAEQSGVRDLALSSVIASRCSRYLNGAAETDCRDAVKKMIKLLDYDIIFGNDLVKRPPNVKANEWTPSSFVFVAFKQNFIALLNNPKTLVYLQDLNLQLYKYLTGEKDQLNIWDVTKTHYKTDYMTSLVIATLFQDTSLMKLHIAYLEHARTQGNAHFLPNKDMLNRVIDTINMILDSSEDNYRALFYPEEIQKYLNRNIYHLYVPLFLTKHMQMNGVPAESAYQATLFMTLSYEFVTSTSDYRYAYSDPERMPGVHTAKDIFGGYCGSNMAFRGMNFNKSFEGIRAAFERSTADGVYVLLRH